MKETAKWVASIVAIIVLFCSLMFNAIQATAIARYDRLDERVRADSKSIEFVLIEIGKVTTRLDGIIENQRVLNEYVGRLYDKIDELYRSDKVK